MLNSDFSKFLKPNHNQTILWLSVGDSISNTYPHYVDDCGCSCFLCKIKPQLIVIQ